MRFTKLSQGFLALLVLFSTNAPLCLPNHGRGSWQERIVRSLRRSLGFERAGGFYGQRLVEIADDAGSRDFIAQFQISGFEVFDEGLRADIRLNVLIGNALLFQAFSDHNHDMADMRIPGFFDIDKPQGDEQNTE